MSSSVQMSFIEGEDVLCGVTFKGFLVGSSTVLFIRLPFVIRLRPRPEPVIEYFDIRMFLSEFLGEFGDTLISERPD